MLSHWSRILAASAAAVLFVSVHSIQAADFAGSVEGVVKSASGQALAGAYVKLVNAERRLTFMLVSQAQGRYTMNNLPPGNYTVQGIGDGFQSKPTPVALTDGKPATADVSLTDKQGDVVPNGWIRSPGRVAGNELDAELPPPNLPAGAGKAIVEGKCGQCHFLHRLTQMRWSHKNWEKKIAWMRDLTGRPIGVKTAVGGWRFMNEMAEIVHRRGLEFAPDFLAIDGGEGGSGAAPQALADHMGLSIEEALPRVVDALLETGLRSRVRVVASGKLVTSAKAAWALCVGADFVNTARGFMFSLGCIQALRCHQNTCPTGVTTHNKRLQRALVVEEKYLRVANYAMNMNREIDMIAHSCGVRHARELRREHVRIVQASGQSVAFNMLYPYPEPKAKMKVA